MEFMKAKRPPPPSLVEEVLAWREDRAFDMPGWYYESKPKMSSVKSSVLPPDFRKPGT